jgi:hypothetical protein
MLIMNTATFSLLEFAILFGAGLLGAIGLQPYLSKMIISLSEKSDKPLTIPMSRLLVAAFLQTVVTLSVATGLGLLLAHSIGLGAPLIEAAIAGQSVTVRLLEMIPAAVIIGAVGTGAILLLDLLFLPHLPAALIEFGRSTSTKQKLAASLYGGIAEELLMRLFLHGCYRGSGTQKRGCQPLVSCGSPPLQSPYYSVSDTCPPPK